MRGMLQHPAAGNERETRSRLSHRDQFATDTAQRNSVASIEPARGDVVVTPACGNMSAGIIRCFTEQILDTLTELAGKTQRDTHAGLDRDRFNRTRGRPRA